MFSESLWLNGMFLTKDLKTLECHGTTPLTRKPNFSADLGTDFLVLYSGYYLPRMEKTCHHVLLQKVSLQPVG